jgi:hypothetical protein
VGYCRKQQLLVFEMMPDDFLGSIEINALFFVQNKTSFQLFV